RAPVPAARGESARGGRWIGTVRRLWRAACVDAEARRSNARRTSNRPVMIPPIQSDPAPSATEFFGHPRGLAVLFATECWERFSYFGNAALVVLYMAKYLFEPGRIEGVLGLGAITAALEFLFGRLEAQPLASQLFGFYTGLAYFTPILRGIIADRLLGQPPTLVHRRR